MRSLSNLSRFLGLYEEWKHIIKSYGFKWKRSDPLATILSIINNNEKDIRSWLFNALERLPDDAAATISFISLTGLRIVEACDSIHLVTQLSDQNRLDEYIDSELLMLQHFRYPKIFLRNSKNTFVSFVSKDLLNLILQVKPNLNHDDLKSRLRKRNMRIRLKDLRKLYATMLRNAGIPSEFIDILQGRISSSIFLRFYYKPLLQQMRNQVMEAITPLEQEILRYF